MFRGAYLHSLDDKGRIIIPQKLRFLLGETFVITKGLDGCLWVFTDEEFKQLEGRLYSQPILSADARRLQRFFPGQCIECTADKQGRVALPAHLREYAAIDKEVMIVGAGNRIEIWSKARWDEFNQALTDELIAVSAKDVGIG